MKIFQNLCAEDSTFENLMIFFFFSESDFGISCKWHEISKSFFWEK